MAPKNNDGSSSLMSEQYDVQSKLDTDDLLGLEAPVAPVQDYDPFSTTSLKKTMTSSRSPANLRKAP